MTMPLLTFQIVFVLLAWFTWYILFGVECYLNGLITQNQFFLPFVGLWQDCYWLFHPSKRPVGWTAMSFVVPHSLLFLSPVSACYLHRLPIFS